MLAGFFLGGEQIRHHHDPGLAASSLALTGLGLVILLTAQGRAAQREANAADAIGEETVDLTDYTIDLQTEVELSRTEFMGEDGEPLGDTALVPDHPGDDPAMRDYLDRKGHPID
jgi:hypothetical protein